MNPLWNTLLVGGVRHGERFVPYPFPFASNETSPKADSVTLFCIA
jgi:hypothetical protein